jgi:glycosyltransferase involved in cell wall biosynthesis
VSWRARSHQPIGRAGVSVVIPCYNYGHFLPGAVGSVLTQEGVDIEVLVIDDCSTDGSADVAEALAARDQRVRIIRHRRNRGHIATYNEGLAQVRHEYTVLLSADDALTPGALARATALLDAHPSVGFVYGHPVTFEREVPPCRTQARSWTIWSGQEWIERRCERVTSCIFSPEVVMRTSVQRHIGGYRPELPHSGDFEMWLRAAVVADVGRINGADQAYYRRHSTSMQHTTFAGNLVDLRARLAAFDVVLGGGDNVPDADRLYQKARRGLAATALNDARRAYDWTGPGVDGSVTDLVAFALEVCPDARELPAWRALQRRRWVTARWPDASVLFAPRRPLDTLTDKVRWRRWRWNGA